MNDLYYKIKKAKKLADTISIAIENDDRPENSCQALCSILDEIFLSFETEKEKAKKMEMDLIHIRQQMEGKIMAPPVAPVDIPKCTACGKLNGHQSFEVCPANNFYYRGHHE